MLASSPVQESADRPRHILHALRFGLATFLQDGCTFAISYARDGGLRGPCNVPKVPRLRGAGSLPPQTCVISSTHRGEGNEHDGHTKWSPVQNRTGAGKHATRPLSGKCDTVPKGSLRRYPPPPGGQVTQVTPVSHRPPGGTKWFHQIP